MPCVTSRGCRCGEVVSATHYITDLTLGLGEVVFDYMKDARKES